MAGQSIPDVVFQPRSRHGMQRGVNQFVDIVRPTLGPVPRLVAVENNFRDKTPELLDSGGLITRRIIQLADRDADVGAMLLRNVLWKQHDEFGDGTATAAVLFGAVYDRGLHYIASGGNAMQLRRHLERGLEAISDELNCATLHVAGKAQITQLAESLCFDAPLAHMLGEIFDIVGEYGQVDIRNGNGRTFERQYVEGMYWTSGVLSPYMYTDQGKMRVDLTNAAILISDLALEDQYQVMQALTTILQAKIQTLVIVANKLSESVISLLLSANREPERFRVVAVRTPGTGIFEQGAALEDLAILTGGRPLLQAAGDAIAKVTVADLGQARRVWADRSYLGIIGGKNDPRALRSHIAALRASLRNLNDPQQHTALQQRIGKLLGGSATLLVGASTESEMAVRSERARKTTKLLRAALRDGVVLGGGLALLGCQAPLRAMLAASTNLDEQVAYRILIRALEEPMRAIVTNAGYDAASVLAQVNDAAAGYGFDVLSGHVVAMAQAGIYDVAAAQKAAVRGAVAGAATLLTVDTVIHKRNPESAAGQT